VTGAVGKHAEELEKAADSKAADSGFRARTRLVPFLKHGHQQHRLERPTLIIGRGVSCDIQVSSALVSRRHARLSLTSLGVAVEDLGSRNGVFVNSERVVGSTRLRPGDRVAVGDELFVYGEDEEAPEQRATEIALPSQRVPRSSFSEADATLATRSADILQLLASVVDKALALGRGDEAEHLIGAHLATALEDAEAGRPLSPDIARTAAGYSVKLASVTGKARWLDHAIRLYGALGLVLPLALVDEMYVLLRRVRGLDLDVLRAYTEKLRERSQELAPAERFVLQRLSGLERLASWQTANNP
jgi:pSer/pThr/pTyr-binding forkhead associated (FHA) protein